MPQKKRTFRRSNGSNNNESSGALDPAVYKLEGDARRWWKTLKDAEGEGFVEALAWRDFWKYFISTIVLMLIGIHSFEKVSNVANAVKNLEMEPADYIASRCEYNRKKGREDHYEASDRHGKIHLGHNHNPDDRYGKIMYNVTHEVIWCTSHQNKNSNGGGNNQCTNGQVFAMIAHQAATSPDSVIFSSFAQRVGLSSSIQDPPMSITTLMRTSVTITTIYHDFPTAIEDIL
uniref:Uncharacterized protein n=1 Tax=Tanacetum cinerariifolium TaxID=118510 RepID=A0A6L2KL13_TANCI|nr:hypothetical protein [Tanacetum cinerariifolium]